MGELALPEFLTSLGKTELKPGGTYATGAVLRLLKLQGPEHVLVVGPRAGSTALFVTMTTHQVTTEALVRHQSEKVTEGDAALQRRATARVGSTDKMPFDSGRFDAAIVEATLSYQLPAQQKASLRELHRVLKPGARLGLHELCWRQPPTPEVQARLSEVWRGEVTPLPVRGWWDRLEDAGFTGIGNELAVVSYFTPRGMEADEGNEVTAQIFHNAFSDAERQRRFAQAYREFTDNRRYYGVIIARAVRA